jgi:hypothetical protein
MLYDVAEAVRRDHARREAGVPLGAPPGARPGGAPGGGPGDATRSHSATALGGALVQGGDDYGGRVGDPLAQGGSDDNTDDRERLRREIDQEKLLDQRDAVRSQRRQRALADERRLAQLRRELDYELVGQTTSGGAAPDDEGSQSCDRREADIARLNRRAPILSENLHHEALDMLDAMVSRGVVSPAVAAAARHELPDVTRIGISSQCWDIHDAEEWLDTISWSIQEHAEVYLRDLLDEITSTSGCKRWTR